MLLNGVISTSLPVSSLANLCKQRHQWPLNVPFSLKVSKEHVTYVCRGPFVSELVRFVRKYRFLCAFMCRTLVGMRPGNSIVPGSNGTCDGNFAYLVSHIHVTRNDELDNCTVFFCIFNQQQISHWCHLTKLMSSNISCVCHILEIGTHLRPQQMAWN